MDLDNFLQLEERFGEFKNDFMFYSALEGLSSALETVHSLNLNAREHDIELGRIGYHHDLRPANVLVDSRTFYLADFGLARLKPEDKGSRTLWKAGLGDYVAPECMDEKMVRKEVGRPLDIWSFGCMVFEIAAYIEGGPGGVKRFQKQRLASGFRSNMTNQYFFSGSDLRPGVVSWFEHFKVKSNSLKSKALRHLLDAASSMLKIDPNERPKVAEVHQKLSLLSLEALFDAVQQALSRHLETAQDQGGVPVTMIRNEIVRLAAWGSALQLTESKPSTDAIDTTSNKYKYFCHILTSLIQKSDSDLKAEETVSPSVVTFSICKPFHEELKVFIDKLCNSLPAMQREKQRQMWLVDSLDTSRKGLHDIESSKLSSQYSDLGVMASTKQEIMTNDDNQDTEMPRPKAKSLKLNPDTFQTKCNFDEGLSIGRYDDKQVLVETISHTANWGDMSGHRREQHMQRTAEVFSKLFGKYILECRGFVTPSSGVSGQHDGAFVWAFPAPPQRQSVQPQNIAPISLFNVLKSRKKNELPLGERFHLAYKLVCCVRELNIVSLLHKNINSRNVVFFVEKESISALSDVFQDPYLVNFRYSQHSANAYQTMKPENGLILQHYQHPDYSLSEDFQETYDYYSIGILLLELGSWTTLDIYLNHNPALKSNPSAFRHELINKYAPRLDYIMGATYRDVTLACLQGDFGQGLEGERGPTVIGKFQDKVVTPLGKLSMAQI